MKTVLNEMRKEILFFKDPKLVALLTAFVLYDIVTHRWHAMVGQLILTGIAEWYLRRDKAC